MRNSKGQFVKGSKEHDVSGLSFGHGWNKGIKGWTNSGSFKKGHIVSQKIRNAVSLQHKGNTYRRGSKHTEESKEKNRLAHLGKVTMKGKNHYNWKGGITSERKKLYFSKEYKLWRKSVFEKDNYTCLWCGQIGGELNADHIKPWAFYPELRFAIDNGRTLCVLCHRKTDTWGNRKNKNI